MPSHLINNYIEAVIYHQTLTTAPQNGVSYSPTRVLPEH
jgi:hypothetical protein